MFLLRGRRIDEMLPTILSIYGNSGLRAHRARANRKRNHRRRKNLVGERILQTIHPSLPVDLLLRPRAVVRRLVRVTNRIAEDGAGEIVVVEAKVDHADIQERGSDLHEAGGRKVEVVVARTVVVITAVARRNRQMKVQSGTTKRSNSIPKGIQMKAKQRL